MRKGNWILLLAIASAGCGPDAVFANPEPEGDTSANEASATDGSGADSSPSGSGGSRAQSYGAVSTGGGPVDASGDDLEGLDDACRSQVQSCWTETGNCIEGPSASANVDTCSNLQEECRAMQFACQGQREQCATQYFFRQADAGPDDPPLGADVDASTVCDGLRGDFEPSGFSLQNDIWGTSVQCCWLEPLESSASGEGGASGNE